MTLPWATSRDFAASDNMLLLARVAETFHCRPSELLGIGKSEVEFNNSPGLGLRQPVPRLWPDDTVALQIDIAAAVSLWRWKQETAARQPGAHEEWW